MTKNGKKDFISNVIKDAKAIGNTQYPSTQTLWKIETFPPKNLAFRVTTNPPTHIIKKIVPNTVSLSLLD